MDFAPPDHDMTFMSHLDSTDKIFTDTVVLSKYLN